MEKFIENIVHDGARMVETKFKECDGRTVLTRYSISPNQGFYLTVPENVKRCYYLDANEKMVLFELYSWAKDNGECKVAMDLVSLKLGITEKTVRTCIKELARKKFVQVSKQGRSNVYTFDDLKNNPYLVLSEFIHEFIKDYYYKSGLHQDQEWVKQMGNEGLRLWREAVVDNLAKVVKKKDFYEPCLQKLSETPDDDDYWNIYTSFTDELLELVHNDVLKKAAKLGLLSDAV